MTYHGQSIADVLDMPCGKAARLFENIPKIRRVLANAVRRGARLSHAGPGRADALGRRGAARQAGGRTVAA